MSRSLSNLVLGLVLAVVGGLVLADGPYGIGIALLAVAGVFAQVGIIGLGVVTGMRDFHEPPPPPREEKPRPWERTSD